MSSLYLCVTAVVFPVLGTTTVHASVFSGGLCAVWSVWSVLAGL